MKRQKLRLMRATAKKLAAEKNPVKLLQELKQLRTELLLQETQKQDWQNQIMMLRSSRR
jgi:hypothetical protein